MNVQVVKSGPGVPGPGPGWEYAICVLLPELWIFYLTRLKVSIRHSVADPDPLVFVGSGSICESRSRSFGSFVGAGTPPPPILIGAGSRRQNLSRTLMLEPDSFSRAGSESFFLTFQ